jgi:hydroxymethylpyrimidine pyrophosphatase-like HAD family hydrolase
LIFTLQAISLAASVQKKLGAEYSVFWAESWVKGIFLVTALPARAGKRNAAEYVAGHLKNHFPPGRTVWAGDSDNDLPMIHAKGMLGIVVGNSFSSRLRSAAQSKGDVVFQAVQVHAAGICEGIKHLYG